MVPKADKGSSAIIIYQEQKDLEFISKNGADEINGNITAGFQKDLRNTINACNILIDTGEKGEICELKPRVSNLERTNQST